MNIFQIRRGIRRYGFNFGLPVMYIDCGFGSSLKPEDVVRKLATKEFQKGMWVTIRNGVGESGISSLIEALKYVGCHVEVEADNMQVAPKWFPKPDRWTVVWRSNSGAFNVNALRRGQDMLICEGLAGLADIVPVLASMDTISLGFILDNVTDIESIWRLQAHVYPSLEDAYA